MWYCSRKGKLTVMAVVSGIGRPAAFHRKSWRWGNAVSTAFGGSKPPDCIKLENNNNEINYEITQVWYK